MFNENLNFICLYYIISLKRELEFKKWGKNYFLNYEWNFTINLINGHFKF